MTEQGSARRISSAFECCRKEGRLGVIAYVPVGYPSIDATVSVVGALADAGVDAVELGIPFSDPLADGPTIQAATASALERGINGRQCLATAAEIRAINENLPLLFMGYYNPILQYGPMEFAYAAKQAGVDGLIVPDLPLEEAEELDAPMRELGLGIVPLVAPTTNEVRVRQLEARGAAFIYVTSRLGVTGARKSLNQELPESIQRVKAAVKAPVAVGFGISSACQVKSLKGLVDAVIVGSALVERLCLQGNPDEAAASFIGSLVKAAA